MKAPALSGAFLLQNIWAVCAVAAGLDFCRQSRNSRLSGFLPLVYFLLTLYFPMKPKPPLLFRNAHINTIFGNNGPRKWLVARRAKALDAVSEEIILDCADGVRLHGVYSPAKEQSRGLVILLHGWEGTAQSTYLLSAAAALHGVGFSIFRLHMRDHGPSHHLNREPFLAVRLEEMLDAVETICQTYPSNYIGLAGFSLGANLAVRIAANIGARAIPLDLAVAVSPPVDPEQAALAIRRYGIYNRYFIRKWQHSFARKIEFFEEHKVHSALLEHRDIWDMHEDFVPRFSSYPDAKNYFRAYALSAENLKSMDAPCRVIMVEDDPIIPIASSFLLPRLEGLVLERQPYGGHCGFVSDYALHSWIDERLLSLFDPAETASGL